MKLLLIFLFVLSVSCSENSKVKFTDQGQKPFASNFAISGKAGEAIKFLLPPGEDADSLTKDLKYKIINPPKFGLVNDLCFLDTNSHSNRSCIYTSDEKFTGIDEIEYNIIDETGAISNTATVYIQVSKSGKNKIEIGQLLRAPITQSKKLDLIWLVDTKKYSEKKIHELKENIYFFTEEILKLKSIDFNMTLVDLNSNFKAKQNAIGNFYEFLKSRALASVEEFSQELNEALELNSKKEPLKKRTFEETIRLNLTNSHSKNLAVFIMLTGGLSEFASTNVNTTEILRNLYTTKSNPKDIKIFSFHKKSNHTTHLSLEKIITMTGGSSFDIKRPLQEGFRAISRELASSFSGKVIELNKNNQINYESIKLSLNGKKLSNAHWKFHKNNIYLFKMPPENSSYLVTYREMSNER